MKQLHLTAVVDLDDDLFQAAETKLKVRPAWTQLVETLKAAGFRFDSSVTIEETRGPVKTQRKPMPKITIVNPPARFSPEEIAERRAGLEPRE